MLKLSLFAAFIAIAYAASGYQPRQPYVIPKIYQASARGYSPPKPYASSNGYAPSGYAETGPVQAVEMLDEAVDQMIRIVVDPAPPCAYPQKKPVPKGYAPKGYSSKGYQPKGYANQSGHAKKTPVPPSGYSTKGYANGYQPPNGYQPNGYLPQSGCGPNIEGNNCMPCQSPLVCFAVFLVLTLIIRIIF